MKTWHRCGGLALLAAMVAGLGVACAWQDESREELVQKKTPTPRQVLIIRHGEKSGDENDIHLTSRGAARAAALPSLFVIPPTFPTKPAAVPTPDFLFAAKTSKRSNRSIETITPLSKALNMTIHQKHADGDFQAVVNDIFGDAKYARKTILICWHHGKIAELAGAIALKANNAGNVRSDVPLHWESSIFDRVWLFTFDDSGNATFANAPQKLLFGDTNK